MIGVTVHHDGVDICQLGKAVHAASVNLAGVHEGDALMGCGDHSRFGLGHLGKVGRKAAAGDKGAGAHDGQIGVDHLERLHGKWTVQIAMTFAQCPTQHDDIDRGHALVDVIGDGNVGRDDGDAVALIEEPDELERRGARVDKQRVAIARALIHNRSILLVDEGTSALDQKNADLVEKSLLTNPDLTLILISHHLSAARRAQFDRVYELAPVTQ